MDVELLFTCALVFALAVVQSLFGVGLLVFGTPCLLLAGMPFVDALYWLLPASFAISVVQIRHGRGELDSFKNEFIWFALPPAALALGGVLWLGADYDVRIPIGALLLLTAAVRVFPARAAELGAVLGQYRRTVLVVTGAIHGLTNMGGALLTILIPNLFASKEAIRANVAFAYLVFVGTQIVVLASVGFAGLSSEHLLSPAIALLAYWSVGQRVFARATAAAYGWALTALTTAFGLTLVGSALH